MDKKYTATLKSAETEDWLDYHVVRPFSYLWALLFARLGVHPNTVTILSMVIGAGSCVFFAHGCYHYEGGEGLLYNLIAFFLLVWADVFDCTDGQLARLTGKKSRLGRILDGVAGFVWFLPIYVALVVRFYHHHSIEFGWLGISDTPTNAAIATALVVVLTGISGFVGMAGQSRLADYYIQVHLFFLKGEKGSELDNSAKQQEIYDSTPWQGNVVWKTFLKSYVGYTQKQEAVTPQFQRLMKRLKERYGSTDNLPAEVREEFHRHSLPLMKYNGLLTFNFRTAFFFLFCLLDVPVLNFVWELTGMALIYWYVNHSHEKFCREMADKL